MNSRKKIMFVWEEATCAMCGAAMPAETDKGWSEAGDTTVYFCPEHTPSHSHLNVYITDRAYGGCEEGGWWYDTHDPVCSVEIDGWTDADVDMLVNLFERNFSNEGRRPISSVASDGVYTIVFEDEPARVQPERRPQYE